MMKHTPPPVVNVAVFVLGTIVVFSYIELSPALHRFRIINSSSKIHRFFFSTCQATETTDISKAAAMASKAADMASSKAATNRTTVVTANHTVRELQVNTMEAEDHLSKAMASSRAATVAPLKVMASTEDRATAASLLSTSNTHPLQHIRPTPDAILTTKAIRTSMEAKVTQRETVAS